MALSGSTSFDLNRSRLVELALMDVGAYGPGVAPSPAARAQANDLLNAIVKEIDVDGRKLWRAVRRDLSVSASTATYTLGSDVWDIDDPANVRTSAGTDRSPISRITIDYYMSLGDRTVTGRPTLFLIERSMASGSYVVTINLFPVPDVAYTLEYVAVLRAQDVLTDAQGVDFPSKWLRYLRYRLALDLAGFYKTPSTRLAFFQEQVDRAAVPLGIDAALEGPRQVRFYPTMVK